MNTYDKICNIVNSYVCFCIGLTVGISINGYESLRGYILGLSDEEVASNIRARIERALPTLKKIDEFFGVN